MQLLTRSWSRIAPPLKALTGRWTPSVPDGLVGMKDNISYFCCNTCKTKGYNSLANTTNLHRISQNLSTPIRLLNILFIIYAINYTRALLDLMCFRTFHQNFALKQKVLCRYRTIKKLPIQTCYTSDANNILENKFDFHIAVSLL